VAVATSNRLLPILAGAVLLMLVFVTLRSCSEDSGDGLVMDRVPEAPAPDADTPADTIKTLTANVAAMTTEVEALRQDNAGLRRENQQLLRNRTQIEENVSTRVKRELLAREKDAANRARIDSGVLSSLSAKVDALAASVDEAKSSMQGSQIPVGVGLNGTGEGTADAIVWIEPLDAVGEDGEGGLFDRVKQGTGNAWDSARSTGASAVDGIGDRIEDLQPVPVYTVPRNATLIGSTAMTALVGRVPIQGQVRDPMPFKVITGAENLAANGLRVPGVQGMVWSGTAIGDWTLSCVTGRVDSVTFVFDDGTIRTLSSDDRQSQSGGEDKPLGWISDARGIPCVSGERKTNAPAFLSQRIGVMAIQAAGQAAAAAETTSVIGDSGSVTNSVTGDTGTYVLGKTVAGGSDEVAKWLLERQSQSFDAVFVPAGTKLAIHVDRELPIDLNPSGRRLQHATAPAGHSRHRLD
jgi:integrating conjugative element protein (TIGR03752 family)